MRANYRLDLMTASNCFTEAFMFITEQMASFVFKKCFPGSLDDCLGRTVLNGQPTSLPKIFQMKITLYEQYLGSPSDAHSPY